MPKASRKWKNFKLSGYIICTNRIIFNTGNMFLQKKTTKSISKFLLHNDQ